jgi:hypothetical protein
VADQNEVVVFERDKDAGLLQFCRELRGEETATGHLPAYAQRAKATWIGRRPVLRRMARFCFSIKSD